MYFDTHCHLDVGQFDDDRDAVFDRAVSAGVTRILNPAYDLPSSLRAIAMAEQHLEVYAAVGIHPNDLAGLSEDSLRELQHLTRHEKVVAIGEIGLDYHWNTFPKAIQREGLIRQLDLAQATNLPVIIHCRDAYDDMLDQITTAKLRVGVLLHSFAGSQEHANRALSLGCLLGIGGPVTYKNAETLRRVVSEVPLASLVLETDAPYLAPHPHRGKRNEPAYLPLTAQRVATTLGMDVYELARVTTRNANRFFGLT